MSVDFELEGIAELMNIIEGMGRAGDKIQNDALKKAGKVVLVDAKADAPKDSGEGAKALKLGKIKKYNDEKYILVGTFEGKGWYLRFPEYGTSKMRAKPFLRPALEKNKNEIIRIMKEELRRGLGLS